MKVLWITNILFSEVESEITVIGEMPHHRYTGVKLAEATVCGLIINN